jgi:hypothetical protein
MMTFYYNWYLADQFSPLAIKVFGCLHQHVDDFSHLCANMTWSAKGFKGLPLLILHSFYKYKVSVALQWVHLTSISRHAIAESEGIF